MHMHYGRREAKGCRKYYALMYAYVRITKAAWLSGYIKVGGSIPVLGILFQLILHYLSY